MQDLPAIRYARVGDDVIAYRDHGGDGTGLVYCGLHGSHQDLIWEEPGYAHFLRSLADLGRLVTFDRRGSGLSSRGMAPTIEARVADVQAVLDSVDLDDAVLVGAGGSTQAALAFATTHPDRCRGLALYSPRARTSRSDDYAIGTPAAVLQDAITQCERVWGTGITALLYAPSLADDRQFVEWAARHERSVATPLEAQAWVDMYRETDVRDLLTHVRSPALVVTPTRAGTHAPKWSRYVAERLGAVRHLEIDAGDEWPFGDGLSAFLEAVTDFVAELGVAPSIPSSAERRLAAVLFTDIVGSTEHLHEVGDRRWRTLLESHDDMSRRSVVRHGGRVVKSTGDGLLAVFDGAGSAVHAAIDLLAGLDRIGIGARAGVHVGETERRGDDVSGIAVHIGSRICDLGGAGDVLATTTVRDLVAGSGLVFESRGEHRVKGMSDPVVVLAASRGR